jgi:exodeoxyribonuclease V alpha subunit
MSPSLERLRELGLLTLLDVHFARTVADIGGEPRATVLLGAALASRATREGHVCLDLTRLGGTRVITPDGNSGDLVWPEFAEWFRHLASSPLCSDGTRPTPLVLTSAGQLYLGRYHVHELRLGELITARLRWSDQPLDVPVLRETLSGLFPDGPPGSGPDWQRVAVQIGALGRLLVLGGGPGTGKTFTVARLIRLLERQAEAFAGPKLKVLLLAPTGKAAARLLESVRLARAEWHEVEGPTSRATAATIHRALGYRGHGPPRHHAERPLDTDLVIVDEASMVDIALMRRLLEAVPDRARLVLVGDQHQLGSVEAGAVFGDLCGPGMNLAYSDRLVTRVHEVFSESLPRAPHPLRPIADSVVTLARGYRFAQDSALGTLARSIRAGDPEHVLACLRAAHPKDVVHVTPPSVRGLAAWLGPLAIEGYGPALRAGSPMDALGALGEFRVLCAHRHGPYGVDTVNGLVEQALAREGLVTLGQRFYRGRPVLVTENDYQLELFNGDIGLVWPETGGSRVIFAGTEGRPRSLIASRLPPHETVFAMSVHKSQGSEFTQVVVVLPEEGSPLLTRELLYTAVTRAKSRLLIYGTLGAIGASVRRAALRASGLRQRLWG